MSNSIEDIVYEAYKQGKREDLLKSLKGIRKINPNMNLTDLYQLAYEQLGVIRLNFVRFQFPFKKINYTINSWNEWIETSYIMSCTMHGYGYLEAIKRVFVEE